MHLKSATSHLPFILIALQYCFTYRFILKIEEKSRKKYESTPGLGKQFKVKKPAQ
ncbi:hypothetical protein ES703_64349 [subsurface metagenome]